MENINSTIPGKSFRERIANKRNEEKQMAEDQVIEELVSELSKEAAIVDRKENRVKYKVKKSKEFKYGNDVFKVKYIRTYRDYRWISVNKKLFWFFYLPATIGGDPKSVKGFMEKINDVVEEMDRDSIS